VKAPIIRELNVADLTLATDFAERRFARGSRYGRDAEDIRQGRRRADDARFTHDELGAQCEIVIARVLGIDPVLDINSFQRWPDLPPDWSVKGAFATSQHIRLGYLQIRAGSMHRGWRHVGVVRDVALDGHFVFVVQGWILNERVYDVGRCLYSNTSNLFVNVKHLERLEPMSQLDEPYWAERAARWYFDDDGTLRIHGEIDTPEAGAA
jgi:hypothetical protein